MTSNAGAPIAGHGVVRATPAEEMAAFEQIGPECRRALNDCVFPWSSIAVLRRFTAKHLHPSNPAHDRIIADELRKIDLSRTEERKVS